MAREAYRGVELTEALRPVASPVDTFVQAQVPSRDTNLQDLARSLTGLGGSLQSLVGKRDAEAEENDRIRGRAAFWESNGTGAAEAVSKGLMPAQASPAYMRGWKETEGAVAGAQLQEKFSAAYDTWEGKASTDPNAFAGFLGGFLKDNIKTQDPDVLRGLLPQVEQLRANWQNRHIGDVSRAAQQGYTTAMAARGDQLIDQANTAGLASKTGTDYAKVFGELEGIRADGLRRGANEAQTDEKLIDTITAAAISKRDPKLLDFLDRKVPGKDYAWGNTPYGREAKQKTVEALEVMGRRSIAEDEKRRREEKADLKDSVTRDSIRWALDHPKEPVPEELLARGEKLDPEFRLNVLRNRKRIEDDRTTSDPDELRGLSEEILLRGGGVQAVQRALDRGVFRNRGDLEHAFKLAEGMKEAAPQLDVLTKSQSYRDLTATIKKRTAGKKDAGKYFDDGSFTSEGLQAMADLNMQALQWVKANPNAGAIDQAKALTEIGAGILKRIEQLEFMGEIGYDRQGLDTPNAYGAASPRREQPQAGQPVAPKPAAPQQPAGNPFAGATVRVPSGLPGVPDEVVPTEALSTQPAPLAPVQQPSAPQPAPARPLVQQQPASVPAAPPPRQAPAPGTPAATAPAAGYAKPGPANATAWFDELPPASRERLETAAATQKKPLQTIVDEVYHRGLDKGLIAPPAPLPAASPEASAAEQVSPEQSAAPGQPAGPSEGIRALENAFSRPGAKRRDGGVFRNPLGAFSDKPLAPWWPKKRKEGEDDERERSSMRAPDGTPIETASATASTADAFSRAIEGAYVGRATFDGTKATLNGQTFTGPASPEQVARRFEGLSESDPQHRAVLTDFLSKAAGQRIDPAKVPWCAAFVDAVLDASGKPKRGSLMASDFLDYGSATEKPTKGDVAVFKSMARGSSGHVGFVVGIEGDRVRYIAGNDDNKVQEDTLPLAKVAGFRRPPEAGTGPFGADAGQAAGAFSRVLGTTGQPTGGYALPELKADPKAARILDLVAGAELNRANRSNYNAYFGNAAATEDLSKRTLDQTIAWSRNRGTSSSATGRYQFMADTMAGLKKEMGLTGAEAFTPELQDRMALALLNRRGYRDYATGKLSTEDFANNLAKEWASLPNLQTGRSHYAGDGVNKALVSPEQVRSVLEGTGVFPGARMASVAKTLTSSVAGSGFVSRVRGMFGGGSASPETTSAPAPASDPYANAPDAGTARRLRAANPDPVGNSAATLGELAPDLAAAIRKAQADNPRLRFAVVARRGEHGAEVWPVDEAGRVSFEPGQQDAVTAAIRRSATQLGIGLNVGGVTGESRRAGIELARVRRA